MQWDGVPVELGNPAQFQGTCSGQIQPWFQIIRFYAGNLIPKKSTE